MRLSSRRSRTGADHAVSEALPCAQVCAAFPAEADELVYRAARWTAVLGWALRTGLTQAPLDPVKVSWPVSHSTVWKLA